MGLDVPPLRAHVNDLAGLLSSADESRIERKLADYERGTGTQLAVLIVPSLQGEPLEDYTMRVAERWKLGEKGKDNGVLLFVALGERKVRIEVGYGLEGVITDAHSSRIIRNVIAPAFREGHFAAGIEQALDLLMRLAGGESVALPRTPRANGGAGHPLWLLFVFFIIMLSFGGRFFGPLFLGSLLFGGRGPRGGFGGGFGGGGFSGGGGGFGGGGASGGW